MAKVTAPLQSFDASGKIGGSIVYFKHLGRNVVRGLVTPSNPRSETQGDSRLLLGALGRMGKAVVSPSDFLTKVRPLTPEGQTWLSYAVRRVIDTFGTGTTGVAALNAALAAHSATDDWESEAAGVGLTDFTISYANATENEITAGAQLYALAVHATQLADANPAIFDASPYDEALADWGSAEIAAFVSDIQSVA